MRVRLRMWRRWERAAKAKRCQVENPQQESEQRRSTAPKKTCSEIHILFTKNASSIRSALPFPLTVSLAASFRPCGCARCNGSGGTLAAAARALRLLLVGGGTELATDTTDLRPVFAAEEVVDAGPDATEEEEGRAAVAVARREEGRCDGAAEAVALAPARDKPDASELERRWALVRWDVPAPAEAG